MATSNTDGSKTATGGVDTLATITTDGSFVLGLDLNDQANGETLVVRAKVKIRSVGTTRIIYEATYTNVQSIPVVVSIPIVSTNEIVFEIEQTVGTGIVAPFEIWEL